MLIGNGWIDPISLYQSYSNVTFQHRLIPDHYKKELDEQTNTCIQLYNQQPRVKIAACESILESILDWSREGGQMCLNMYDMRLRDTAPGQGCGMAWPNGLSDTAKYLSVSHLFF
jgi:carboxypeptidase D